MITEPIINELIFPLEWQDFRTEFPLSKQANYVFNISVDHYFKLIRNNYTEVLSDQEQDKSLRFAVNADRERFICGKYAARMILSRILELQPAQIEFQFNAQRKPFINGIHFNLSHSENCLLIATSSAPIGVDVEIIQPEFDFESIMPGNFSLSEIASIKTAKNRHANFYTLWTRKEAILKASGEGLTDELALVPSLQRQVQRAGLTYKIDSFRIQEKYVASLATHSDQDKIVYYRHAPTSAK